MSRGNFHEEQDSQDSFLDVVANVVGVLIILVMLVGMQASRTLLAKQESAPQETPDPVEIRVPEAGLSAEQFAKLTDQVKAARRAALQAKDRVTALANKVARLAVESAAHDKQRSELAIHREVVEQEIERRRQLLDEKDQQKFDVQRTILESKMKLEKLNQERIVLASAVNEVEQIENVPTPMVKETENLSIHLRLHKGLLSIVPVEPLLDELRARSSGILSRLQRTGEVVEVVGPIDGYRAKAVFVKLARRPVGGATVGNRTRYELDTYTEFTPLTNEIGQNVEQALTPGSQIYDYLQSRRRTSQTVDVWLYTDSFDEFRTLKKALWEMGFAISTRPLQPGDKIGASPHGTKSAAQ